MYGSNWPRILCDEWLRTDRYLKNFAHELPQCPCTLEQALIDKGKYMPDFDCDKDSNPTCYYNNQAVHCVRTGSPTYVFTYFTFPSLKCYNTGWRVQNNSAATIKTTT